MNPKIPKTPIFVIFARALGPGRHPNGLRRDSGSFSRSECLKQIHGDQFQSFSKLSSLTHMQMSYIVRVNSEPSSNPASSSQLLGINLWEPLCHPEGGSLRCFFGKARRCVSKIGSNCEKKAVFVFLSIPSHNPYPLGHQKGRKGGEMFTPLI